MRLTTVILLLAITQYSSAQVLAGPRDPAMQDHQDRTVIHETITEPDGGGIGLEAAYVGELGRNLSGGMKVGSSYLGLATLRANFDLEKLAGFSGLSVFTHFQATHGDDPTDLVGDAQATSNIQAPANTAKLFEAWIQQSAPDGSASILLGLYDLNSEFYVTKPAGMFLNSSFGIGAEIAQTSGPSIFPTAGLAVRARVETQKRVYLQTAVAEATPGHPERIHGTQVRYSPEDGHFFISESGIALENMKLAFGGWAYSESGSAGNAGAYLTGDYTFEKNISVFLRYGTANGSLNQFFSNLSAGVVGTGVISSRPDDQIGLGLTVVSNSDDFKADAKALGVPVDDSEMTIEIAYTFQFGDDMSLQPDLQYVLNPSMDPNLENAICAALRFRIGLEK